MALETFSLADNIGHSSLYSDLSAHETYTTRLVRVDTGSAQNVRSPLQHGLQKCLRACWFYCVSRKRRHQRENLGNPTVEIEAKLKDSCQNTIRCADFIARFLITLFAGAFLVGPLVILSYQSSREAHLVTVAICIVFFNFVTCLSVKASAQGMAASAAYAAVLVVFVSNN
jgi:hypothetical protein